MRKVEIYSLDFLMYAHEVRLEEDELMDEGRMDGASRTSPAEMRRRYVRYLRNLAKY